jgi:Protein of unknown function
MSPESAAEIQQHLLDADQAMGRARRAIAGLPQDEREKFDELLRQVLAALHLDLLAALHDEHPELKPPQEAEEIPRINSELRWDQVRLPKSMSETDIDAVIFSTMQPHWRKVAMVVVQALKRCEQLGLAISDEALAARIQVLAESGRIEGAGDLRKWSYSEIRLKD